MRRRLEVRRPAAHLLRRHRPDVIHSWLFTANTWARVAGRLTGIPAIITSERGMELSRSNVHNRVDHLLQPLADRVIVNAHFLARHVIENRHVPADKIVVIPNGVDTVRFDSNVDRMEARQRLGLPLDRPIIGMAASFSPRKRWDLFLHVVQRVAETHQVLALAVGEGKLRTEIERQARQMALGDTVRFLGVRPDMPDVMSALDVFLLTSDDEGLPNVVLEAMAAGRPAVATDAGGTHEAIRSGQTGIVTPLRDVEGLAEATSLLLDEPELAARYGAAGREVVEREFSFDACVNRTCDLYLEVLGEVDRTAATLAVV